MSDFKTDIQIAQDATLSHINHIADKLSISNDDLEYIKKNLKLIFL